MLIVALIICFLIGYLFIHNIILEKYNYTGIKPIDTRMINIGPFILENEKKIYIYNPSILNDNGKILYTARISGNRNNTTLIKNFNYKSNININREFNNNLHNFEDSSIIIWEKEDDFQIRSPFKKNNLNLKANFQGIEDPRLFKYLNDIWIYAHYRGNIDNSFVHRPIIFKLSDMKIIYLTCSLTTNNKMEKNWMPFVYENKLFFEYSIDPHIIILCDINTGHCKEIYKTYTEIKFSKNIGGGAPSQLINYNGTQCFLGVGHTRHKGRFSFFYLYENKPPFKIFKRTEEFKIDNNEKIKVEFTSGLTVVDNLVTITYGINDCCGAISKFKLTNIIENMENC